MENTDDSGGRGPYDRPMPGYAESLELFEHDRRRWARELHDEVLQSLSAMRMRLAAARRRGSAAELEAALEATFVGLGEQIAALRSLSTELRPAVLDQLGLEAALRALAEHHAAADGLEVMTRVELAGGHNGQNGGGRRLEPALESAIYRIVQEAFSEIARHASARRVTLALVEDEDGFELTIEDDGSGFGQAARLRDVAALRRRLELMGGELEVAPRSGDGTVVRGRVPHPAAPATT